MDSIEQLIADWIRIRTTLKGQLKHFEAGHTVIVGQDSSHVTAEATERVRRCVIEIELLISHYSQRG